MIKLKAGEISLVDRAVGFAARAHRCQWRKTGEKMPYIAHPVGAALILQQMGCRQEVVAAGLLHDTVEDTKVTMEEIISVFGQEVADIVAGCTEPPKKRGNWLERKVHMVGSLRDASLEVKLVAASDKFHNLNHALATKKLGKKNIWKDFGQKEEQQAWYYRSVYASIMANVSEPDQYAVFEQLGRVIGELFEGVASKQPSK